MKYYCFAESRIGKMFLGFLMLVLLLLARDTMIFHCLVGFNRSYAITIAVLGVAGVVFLWHNKQSIKMILTDKRVLLLAVTAVVYLLPMAVKQDWQLMHITILLGSCVAVFMSYFVSHKQIARSYVVFMAILALYSLIATYFLRNFADSGLFEVQTFSNAGVRDYYNFVLAFPSVEEHRSRNFGMFREPGVYQFFILLALFLNNWKVEWDKSWKLWGINMILAVTMLSTQSTNGVVELGLLAVLLFIDKKLYQNKPIMILFVSACVALIGVVTYSLLTKTLLYDYLDSVFYKLFRQSNSTTARMESILVDTQFFLRNPIFGEKLATVLHAVVDNTSSTMILFAMYGLMGGFIHIAGWTALVWDRQRNLLLNLGFLVTILMSFNTQNLTWDIMFWLFPMMALTEKTVPWLEKRLAK